MVVVPFTNGVVILPHASDRVRDARLLADRLLSEHGLHDWSFVFNRRKNCMGYCSFDTRTIELSIHFVERNAMDQVRDTLLHEIAHALVGPGHGHDAVWKRKCLEVGARPERCGQADMPAGDWQARCKSCGKVYHRHRRPRPLRGWYCPPCGADHGKLNWKCDAAN